MLQIDLKETGLNETTRALLNLPGIFQRARRSALSSVGWWAAQELRNHIEYGGTGWRRLHPLTLKLRKFRSAPASPLFFLGRFARYMVSPDANEVKIDLGKGYATKSGGWAQYRERPDPWLAGAVRRHEEGTRVAVTKRVRLAWLSTKIKGKKYKKKSRSGAVTGGYFVLHPETTHITIPKRPIFSPVFKKVQSNVMPRFEKQFTAALKRYMEGGRTA